jgi:hypothetical protein
MCPSARNYAAEHFHAPESRNESDHSNNNKLAYSGLEYARSGDDSDSPKLRQRSTRTDSNCTLYSGGGKQWRAVADVSMYCR